MLRWLVNNKEWVLSGIGVAIASALVRWLVRTRKHAAAQTVQTISSGPGIQIGGDVHGQITLATGAVGNADAASREDRVSKFVEAYSSLVRSHYASGWYALLPAGITELRSDAEIREALDRCRLRTGKHPMGSYEVLFVGVDLKHFFEWCGREGIDWARVNPAEAIERWRNR